MNYEETLLKLVENDERFIVMTAENRAAIRNLQQKIGNRFIDTGITEMTLIGMAAGLALRGRIPVTHALATFLTMRAFEFIRTDVGIANLPVKIVGGFPGLLSEANGPTHQAIEDISLMRGIPNMRIFCPADENDMLKCIETILYSPSPYYIRYNNRKPVYRHLNNYVEGHAEIISTGKDINILTYGVLFTEALEVMELLEKKGLRTGLVNLRTLKPIDEEVILDSLKNYGMTVTLEDHFLTGGLFSIVSEIAMKNNVSGNVLPISFEEKWFKPALYNDVLDYEGLNPKSIFEKIIKKLEEKK
ncbi:MAG: transketolase C-terminal domain-containing protein [Ignavibacteria bacterium]|nr:transketolase C-terminal domain-containing protein [Ignavibacteria bacterium]